MHLVAAPNPNPHPNPNPNPNPKQVDNSRILAHRLSAQHLLRFLREQMAAAPSASELTPATSLSADPSELPMVAMDFALSARVPSRLWPAALAFFSTRPETPPAELAPEDSPPPVLTPAGAAI